MLWILGYGVTASSLARCPCGAIPTELVISDAGQGGKYALVQGNCCGKWMIEFRTEYADLDDKKCFSLAVAAWNSATRG